MNAAAIIPSRFASERLPGKPLADICGKPLIRRVWECVGRSQKINRIIIATDNESIFKACREFNAEVVMTPEDLQSGTDRIAWVYRKLNLDANIIVNVQGDEPMIKGEMIDMLIEKLESSNADVCTFIKKIEKHHELIDPAVVKVEISSDSTALCFSRSPIPFNRDLPLHKWTQHHNYWKHLGVYAYKKEALMKFVMLPPTELELIEKLEQLRLMVHGSKYLCVETDSDTIGVDTQEDLENIRTIFGSI